MSSKESFFAMRIRDGFRAKNSEKSTEIHKLAQTVIYFTFVAAAFIADNDRSFLFRNCSRAA